MELKSLYMAGPSLVQQKYMIFNLFHSTPGPPLSLALLMILLVSELIGPLLYSMKYNLKNFLWQLNKNKWPNCVEILHVKFPNFCLLSLKLSFNYFLKTPCQKFLVLFTNTLEVGGTPCRSNADRSNTLMETLERFLANLDLKRASKEGWLMDINFGLVSTAHAQSSLTWGVT